MRILILNQCFWPDVVATAQIAHDLSRYLTREGHEVTVVSSRSVYGEMGDAFPGREQADGIEIFRVKGALFGKRGVLLRIVDFGLFYLRAFARVISLPRHDVVVSLTTPPFIALVGILVGRIRGNRTAYWVMDLYPDLPVACGLLAESSPIARLLERVNRFCLRRSDATVVLGRCMQERVLSKGIPADRVHAIPVWSDQESVKPIPKESNSYRNEWDVKDNLVVMYSGNFGLGHDVQTFLEAARRLADDDRIRFVFVGGGKKKAVVETFVSEHSLDNCRLAPYQPRESLGALLSAADVHLASMLDGIDGLMVPSKLYGIMAAARPCVFIGPEGSEVARTLQEERCGRVVSNGDVEGVIDALTGYADDPQCAKEEGDRARAALESKYAKDELCAQWMELLETISSRNRDSG